MRKSAKAFLDNLRRTGTFYTPFEDTLLSVAMLTLRKSSLDKSILFVVGDDERRVECNEIADNGFDLSPNRYVLKAEKSDRWKDFNPREEEEKIRALVCERLDKHISVSELVCSIDTCVNSIDDFLDRLQAVINKHRDSLSSPDNQTRTEDCQ